MDFAHFDALAGYELLRLVLHINNSIPLSKIKQVLLAIVNLVESIFAWLENLLIDWRKNLGSLRDFVENASRGTVDSRVDLRRLVSLLSLISKVNPI